MKQEIVARTMSTVKTSTLLEPWDLVVTRSAERPLTFNVASIAADATAVHIVNTDQTVTVVEGIDLLLSEAVNAKAAVRVRFTGGEVHSLRRLDRNGDLLEALDGLRLSAQSFATPPAGTSCLAWAMEHFDDRAASRAAGISDRLYQGGLGGGRLDNGERTTKWFLFVVVPVGLALLGLLLHLNK